MERMKKLINLINQSASALEKIADSRGVARASNITMLSELLLAMADEIGGLAKELENLRKFKEEHSGPADGEKEGT